MNFLLSYLKPLLIILVFLFVFFLNFRSAYLSLLKICKLLLTVVVIVVAHILDFSPDKLQAFLEPQTLSSLNNILSASQHHLPDAEDSNEAVENNTEGLADGESDKDRQYFTLLKQIMHNIPNTTDTMVWTVGVKLGTSIAKQVGSLFCSSPPMN